MPTHAPPPTHRLPPEAVDAALARLEAGDRVEGAVAQITDYGAWIDIGGVVGLLLLPEISWGRVPHPSRLLSVGQRLSLAVVRVARPQRAVSLSLKRLTPDPWAGIEARLPPGARAEGRVVALPGYGAFVEVERHVEGLAHRELLGERWGRLRIGDPLAVEVLSIDLEQRKMTLAPA